MILGLSLSTAMDKKAGAKAPPPVPTAVRREQRRLLLETYLGTRDENEGDLY